MRKTHFIGVGLLGLALVTGCDTSTPESERSLPAEGEPDEEPSDGDWSLTSTCGFTQTELIAGQHHDTGTVQIGNDADAITVSVATADAYQLSEVHIYVGDQPLQFGVPGSFPYKQEFDQPVDSHQIDIPLDEVAAACGSHLHVAVHAVVVSHDEEGNEVFNETAWALGTSVFLNKWGWSLGYEVCCNPGETIHRPPHGGGGSGGDDGGGEPTDDDHDGVPLDWDCDDNDPKVGALLYENHFDEDTGYLSVGPKLLDPWTFDGEAHTTDGGQQALLGLPETWTNTVTYGSLRVSDVEMECGNFCENDETRFRAGFLARTTEDADQDEGFHGYRCAVAQNSGLDCFDPGPFVQLAAFLDGPEDDIDSECANGCLPNPTFDQLDRQERSDATDFMAGDSGSLVFWAVGQELVCEFYGDENEHVVARAVDDRFDSGTTGLSTLNALADFDHVRVCEAFAVPE